MKIIFNNEKRDFNEDNEEIETLEINTIKYKETQITAKAKNGRIIDSECFIKKLNNENI